MNDFAQESNNRANYKMAETFKSAPAMEQGRKRAVQPLWARRTPDWYTKMETLNSYHPA